MNPEARPVAAGRLIDRRFRLRERIGAGGMGEVWRATDEKLKRTVAIKLIGSRVVADDPTLLRRFRREAEITARLSHPNIVTVYDVGDDPLYVVMELVQGTGLHDLVRAPRPCEPARLISWGVQICDALAVAHADDIVHRDLKPSNLILTRDGRIKVVDFGIAAIVRGPGNLTQATPLTPEGAAIGTPGYMPPEQILGGRITPSTDLYALGCVLYALAVGEPPFGTTGSIYEVFDRHLSQRPSPPAELRPGLPAGLDRLILDLLEKNPRDRPPGALAVRQRLSALDASPAGGGGRSGASGSAPPGLRPTGPLTAAGLPGPDLVGSAEEKESILRYLLRAPVAVPSMILETDRVRPSHEPTVPTSVRTDGVWVWSDRLAYYLRHHGLAPEPDFRRHIAAQGETIPSVTPHDLVAASRLFSPPEEAPEESTRRDRQRP